MTRQDLLAQLDDADRMRALDPSGMYDRIRGLPEQMQDALAIMRRREVRREGFHDVTEVVIVGMGGSAIGGDLVRTLTHLQLQVPLQVCRHYRLPQYVDERTLVIASSYSGNTEETLSAFAEALDRRCMFAAITTGGKLGELARVNGIPTVRIPPGLQPRAAIGYSFVPLLMLLEEAGLVEGMADQVSRTTANLVSLRDRYDRSVPAADNPAKQLAAQIHGRVAIVYGGPELTDVVAVRWKGQICENGKNMAFANQYTEFNHNELVAWSRTIAPHRDHLAVIQLKDAGDHPKVSRRREIVGSIIEGLGVPVVEVASSGTVPLERMFSLIQMGDFVSYYLAVLNEVDPTPVDAIETLKRKLAESG
ncbi:MAG TPA: bifunctional phosphoglucose/phosphomannose isomerase [Acidobacteriota bacterium]|nr:bifunctional phosphoglucose/phosphomannose isomerase [Acidobacteriota bacterium]